MNNDVGPLRSAPTLQRALGYIESLREVCERPRAPRAGLDPEWIDWMDLRNMRLVAECITRSALNRTESRGAHQREDHPETSPDWQAHQVIQDEHCTIARLAR